MFLDDDEEPLPTSPRMAASAAPSGPQRPRRPSADRQRQILMRRAVALGSGLLILILILLGIRGCLDARKERNFENYLSDLGDIAIESKRLSDEFFTGLERPGDLSELDFRSEVAARRGTAEGHVNRAGALDTPGELEDAQQELDLAFRLRRDALAGIANQVATALGNEGQEEATQEIAGYMRSFLASDVLYARAREEIKQVLAEEKIDGTVPESEFLPDDKWLDENEVRVALAGVSGEQVKVGGVHGLALVGVVADGVTLDPAVPATLSGVTELAVDVENQGESEETEVRVKFELTSATEAIEGKATVPSIAPEETQTATIPIESNVPLGQELSLTVTVESVPGEEIKDNNTATYTVIFA